MSDPAKPKAGRDPISALVLRLTVVTIGVLLLAAGAASWLSLRSFDPLFQPELARKAQTVGDLLAAQIDRGLAARIPLNRMPGLDRLFADEAGRHVDIAYVAVTDPAGRIVAAAGKPLRGITALPPERRVGLGLAPQGKEVDVLGASRCFGGIGQALLLGHGVDASRFARIGAPHKRHFRQIVSGQMVQLRCGGQKTSRVHPAHGRDGRR